MGEKGEFKKAIIRIKKKTSGKSKRTMKTTLGMWKTALFDRQSSPSNRRYLLWSMLSTNTSDKIALISLHDRCANHRKSETNQIPYEQVEQGAENRQLREITGDRRWGRIGHSVDLNRLIGRERHHRTAIFARDPGQEGALWCGLRVARCRAIRNLQIAPFHGG